MRTSQTVWGDGLRAYTVEAKLGRRRQRCRASRSPKQSGDAKVLRHCAKAFQPTGGLKVLTGNLGHAVIKISAVQAGAPRHRGAGASCSTASRRCSDAFKAGELDRDFIAVVRFQGPKANGMPELHKLTPSLGVLQDRGHQGGAGHRRPHVRRLAARCRRPST